MQKIYIKQEKSLKILLTYQLSMGCDFKRCNPEISSFCSDQSKDQIPDVSRFFVRKKKNCDKKKAYEA